jgi:CcmD family protein
MKNRWKTVVPFLWGAVLAVLLWGSLPMGVLAQEPGRILPGTRLSFVFAVYSLTWVIFFGYAFFMARKQQELKRELESLRRALEERERRGQGPSPPPRP